jgi:ABC-type multidrug transport system fused ATPase/permease subunit
VDLDTDQKIQVTMRTAFKDATVITIAHRIGTIIDGDMIIVMDKGCIAEYGEPYQLLQNPSGVFSNLVDETGPAGPALREAATKAHESRLRFTAL